jgi:hypothetical protein
LHVPGRRIVRVAGCRCGVAHCDLPSALVHAAGTATAPGRPSMSPA